MNNNLNIEVPIILTYKGLNNLLHNLIKQEKLKFKLLNYEFYIQEISILPRKKSDSIFIDIKATFHSPFLRFSAWISGDPSYNKKDNSLLTQNLNIKLLDNTLVSNNLVESIINGLIQKFSIYPLDNFNKMLVKSLYKTLEKNGLSPELIDLNTQTKLNQFVISHEKIECIICVQGNVKLFIL